MYCRRCGRSQPPLPRGVYSCVFCSAALPVMRWRATPPPGIRPAGRPRVLARPSPGPPSYRGRPPRWGLPTVAWRPADLTRTGPDRMAPPLTLLRWLTALAWATAVVAVVAAGAETWRFLLLLGNRTLVLPDGPVRASNALVAAAGWTMLGIGLVTAVVAVPAVVRSHAAAADRLGLAPARAPAAVVARLVVPGANVFGAGQMLAEVDGLLAGSPEGSGPFRPRLSRLVAWWWLAWVADAAFVVAALVRGFGRDPQAVADTIELHIGIDLAAALVAALTAVLAGRFRKRFGDGGDVLHGWRVAGPAPTSDRRPAQRRLSVAEEPRATESTPAAT